MKFIVIYEMKDQFKQYLDENGYWSETRKDARKFNSESAAERAIPKKMPMKYIRIEQELMFTEVV